MAAFACREGESPEAYAGRLRHEVEQRDATIRELRGRLGDADGHHGEVEPMKVSPAGPGAPLGQRLLEGLLPSPGALGLGLRAAAALAALLAIVPALLYRLDAELLYEGQGVAVPASLKGQNVLITGSSQGIGYYSAREFCRRGAHVIVTGRRKAKTEKAAMEVGPPTLTTAMVVDVADFRDVRRFATEVTKHFDEFHILVFNAGIGYGPYTPRNTTSKSGHDLAYATNYLGHFLLLKLLWDKLAPGASLVCVGSAAMWGGNIASLTPKSRPRYDNWQVGQPRPKAYANSKLAEYCWFKALRRKLGSGYTVSPMAPGFVNTAILGAETQNSCVKKWLKGWCGSPEVSGRLVLESAFVTKRPQPEFLYPYAWPRMVFEWYAPSSREAARRGRPFGYPADYMRLTFGTLHASVGPECTVEHQEKLWKWSANATGVTP